MTPPERSSLPSTLGYVAVPSGETVPPVLIIHSWWGLTASFTQFADHLAASGRLAGCVDLFGGETASTVDEARHLRSARRREPAYRILQRSLLELADHPRASRTDAAVVGFSMGGHWAIWLAQHPPPSVSSVVLYYAARGGDFSRASAPMLAHFADQDPYVSGPARRTMERAIARHGLSYAAYDYRGAGHWFAESDHVAFDPEAAARSYRRTSSFLSATSRPTPNRAKPGEPPRDP